MRKIPRTPDYLRLYVITDCRYHGRSHAEVVEKAIDAGTCTAARERCSLQEFIRMPVSRGRHEKDAVFIINDRLISLCWVQTAFIWGRMIG